MEFEADLLDISMESLVHGCPTIVVTMAVKGTYSRDDIARFVASMTELVFLARERQPVTVSIRGI